MATHEQPTGMGGEAEDMAKYFADKEAREQKEGPAGKEEREARRAGITRDIADMEKLIASTEKLGGATETFKASLEAKKQELRNLEN